MDDEDTLLPRKLQAALEQALERKNELINQDSDSDSDDGKLIWKLINSHVGSILSFHPGERKMGLQYWDTICSIKDSLWMHKEWDW